MLIDDIRSYRNEVRFRSLENKVAGSDHIYPFCSVRSTNVYEEQSLGIFDPREHDGIEDNASTSDTGSHRRTWSRYLTTHARKQLAFGASICATRDMNSYITHRYVVFGPVFIRYLYY